MPQVYRAKLYIHETETEDGKPDWEYQDYELRSWAHTPTIQEWFATWTAPEVIWPGFHYWMDIYDPKDVIVASGELFAAPGALPA